MNTLLHLRPPSASLQFDHRPRTWTNNDNAFESRQAPSSASARTDKRRLAGRKSRPLFPLSLFFPYVFLLFFCDFSSAFSPLRFPTVPAIIATSTIASTQLTCTARPASPPSIATGKPPGVQSLIPACELAALLRRKLLLRPRNVASIATPHRAALCASRRQVSPTIRIFTLGVLSSSRSAVRSAPRLSQRRPLSFACCRSPGESTQWPRATATTRW